MQKSALKTIGVGAVVIATSTLVYNYVCGPNHRQSRNKVIMAEPQSFERCVKSQMFIDDSRRVVIEKTNRWLRRLASESGLKHVNRCHQLIMGRKGVGKTHLLLALKKACSIVYPNVITVHVPLHKATSGGYDLLSFLYKKLDIFSYMPLIDLDYTDALEYLSDYLKHRNKRLFILIDELQQVFSSKFHLPMYNDDSCGKHFVHELAAMVDSCRGMWYIVATGSSSDIRRIAFNKWTSSDRDKYPNFCGIDLNHQKLQPHYIYGISTANDFRQFVEFVNTQYPECQVAATANFYIKTGGIPGLICGANPDSYSIGAKGLEKNPWLQAMYYCVQAARTDRAPEDDLGRLCDTLSFVTVDTVIQAYALKFADSQAYTHEAKRSHSDEYLKKQLYDYADRGILRYDRDNNRVSFDSPRVWIDVAADMALNADQRTQVAAYHP